MFHTLSFGRAPAPWQSVLGLKISGRNRIGKLSSGKLGLVQNDFTATGLQGVYPVHLLSISADGFTQLWYRLHRSL